MLKSAKTGQYLGILERSGQNVLHLFDYSFNRSRELIFIKSPGDKAGTWKFLNLASGMFIGRVSKVRIVMQSVECHLTFPLRRNPRHKGAFF